jgi:hypothetical protein
MSNAGANRRLAEIKGIRSRGMLRAASILIGLCGCVLLAGCDDDDFGEQAKAFVNEEVHGISRAHVDAELDNILAQAFGDSLVQLDADAKLAATMAENFSTTAMTMDPGTVSNDDLIKEFNNLDAQSGTIFRLITQLEANNQLIRRLDSTCTDDHIFSALGIGNLGSLGPIAVATGSLAQRKADISVSASTGSDTPWYVTVGEAVVSVFGASRIDSENNKLKEAIAQVPERIVHEQEVHDIYRIKCRKMLDELTPDYARIGVMTEVTRQSLSASLVAVQATRAIVEAILRTRDINQFLASSGVTQQLSDAQNLIMRGELGTDLLLTMRRLRGRRAEIRQETQCVRALASIEDYGDELSEFKVQLQALRPDVAALPDLPEKFDQSIQLIDQMLVSIEAQYSWARTTVCQ